MDLKQLRQFVAIVDSGSLSRAAAAIHTAQPALSSLLAQMETELDTQLMVRTRQGVVPTGAGERLYRHARAILRQVEEARRDVLHAADNVSGRVSIGLPASTALLAVPLLKKIRDAYPGIHLEIFESFSGYLSELLLNNRLNLALLMTNTQQKGIDAAPLLTESLYLVSRIPQEAPLPSAPPLVDMRTMTKHRVVLPGKNSSHMRTIVEHAFRQAGVTLSVVADIDSLSTLLEAVRQGMADTILPMCALGPPRQGREAFVLRKLLHPGIRRSLHLCQPEGVPATAATSLVASLLVNEIQRLLPTGIWGDAQAAWSGAESSSCPRRWRDRCGADSGICLRNSDKKSWPKIAGMIRHGYCTARASG